ncbi:hypothetical protein ACTND8_08130 [Atopobiaceae bacterium HCP3S3_F7]|jgi:hypothetical protein|uniref:hypothetical protein n=1 Tax=Collinsella sp. Sow4_E3 TaxID=3438776 RepID=UPI003F8FBA50
MKTNERIRRLLDNTELSNPHDVAGALLNELDNTLPIAARADLYRATLAEVLPTYVGVEFSRTRMLNPVAVVVDDVTPVREPAGSAKVAACRNDWNARKNTPVWLPNGWKRLADCTADDLLALAATLRDRAEKVAAKAAWYEALADALPEGATVAALDTDPTAVTR